MLNDLASLEVLFDEDSLDLDATVLPKLTAILEVLLSNDASQEVIEKIRRLDNAEVKEFITNIGRRTRLIPRI